MFPRIGSFPAFSIARNHYSSTRLNSQAFDAVEVSGYWFTWTARKKRKGQSFRVF
ncbi:hypothetical protein GJU39_09230 [Pedobacter petrophilus]|uniref:Uncharacterized protein n=1 Tax=Pedobacter petrophilus TaxID=1908241 RepID=A0A7K0FXU9_9SPHI|nr:hypothetical protein [Pedobacter petrophilus]MRX76271.1 hypothetical protein [Pedobacter petrophilus]